MYAPSPVLIAIAKAESGLNQYKRDGSMLCDGVTGTHCGLFQIGREHIPQAKKLGYDIKTPEGNIAYAIWLFRQQGTGPWIASYNDSSNPNSWGKDFNRDGTPKGVEGS